MGMIHVMSSQVVRLMSFVTVNISSIEGNPEGRRNDLSLSLSLSLSLWLTRVCELIEVCKFKVWCGGVVRL
jgi:hypothetical protein